MADTAVEATPAEPPKAETGTAEEILSQEKAETATNGKKKAAETTHNDTAKTGPGSTKDKEDQDNKKIGRDWNNRPKHRGGNSGRQIDKKFSKREGAKNMSKNVGNLSKLTFDEPSDDPVQIRKQVKFLSLSCFLSTHCSSRLSSTSPTRICRMTGFSSTLSVEQRIRLCRSL